MNTDKSTIDAELESLQLDTFGYFLLWTNLQNGLVLDKTAPYAYTVLAMVARTRNQHDDALRLYREAIQRAGTDTLFADVKAKNDLYLDSYRKAGHQAAPEIMVAMHVYLHQNEPAAVDGARPYFERNISFHKTHRRPGSKIPQLDNIKQERLALFTAPEDAVAILSEYKKAGVTHVIGMVNFGGVPMGEVRRTLELMSEEVFPNFK